MKQHTVYIHVWISYFFRNTNYWSGHIRGCYYNNNNNNTYIFFTNDWLIFCGIRLYLTPVIYSTYKFQCLFFHKMYGGMETHVGKILLANAHHIAFTHFWLTSWPKEILYYLLVLIFSCVSILFLSKTWTIKLEEKKYNFECIQWTVQLVITNTKRRSRRLTPRRQRDKDSLPRTGRLEKRDFWTALLWHNI